MKKLQRTVSCLLCTVMLLSPSVEVINAATTNADGQSNAAKTSFGGIQGDMKAEAPILQEIEDERTEFSKEFLLEDGTKMIAVYDQPIHFQNDKKEWVDFDGSLTEKDGKAFTNKSGDVSVVLSKESSEQNMAQLSSGAYSVSWGYEGINEKQLKAVEAHENLSGNKRFTNLTGVTSEALLSDAFKNIDIQYFITSTGAKENIILKSADVQNEFNITYQAVGLTAKQADDTSISLVDQDGEEIYRVLAPYMTDAKGVSSSQIKLELISQEKDTVKVKLSVDKEFITDRERSFPITIDPEITKNFVRLFTLDECVGDIRAYHGPYYLSTGHRVLTKLNNLPTLDEGEQIVSARFTYDITNGGTLFSSENENAIIVKAHKVNSFNGDYLSVDNSVLDYDSLSYNDNAQLTFDLTKLVKDWYADNEPQNGFVLEANETIGTKQVNVKDRNNTDLHPSITIVYKDFKSSENGSSFHSFTAGQNATASVSDYLGNLVVNQSLYDGNGTRMSPSVSVTYNSIENAWAFSFNQKITAASAEMAAFGYDYIYTDAQGANHYLKKDDSSNEWYDEDGLGITLTVGDNALTVENGTTQTYALPTAGGFLLSEATEKENDFTDTVSYTYSNGAVTAITNGANQTVSVNYSNGVVASLGLPGSKTISFAYTDGQITKIIFPGNRMSRFSYNNGKLVLVEQADSLSGSESVNSKLGFTFTGDKVTRVTEYGSDGTEGNYLNFAYGTDNSTVFTDKNGKSETYTFDNDGNRISVLNENGYLESNPSEGLVITSGADSFTKNYLAGAISNVGQYNGKNSDGTLTSSGGSVSADSSVKYFGTGNSIKVENPASQSNAAFYTSATIPLNVSSFTGEDITVSAYVKTNDVLQIDGTGVVGASLSIVCHKANEDVYYNSVGITGTEGWQRLSISAGITNDITSCELRCNLRNASGSAWFDCFQLEQGNSVNDYNALLNGDFSDNTSWETEAGAAVSVQNGVVTLGGVAGAFDDVQEETVQETTVEAVEPSTYYVEETVTSPNDSVITYDSFGNQIKTERGFVTRTIKKTYEVEATDSSEPTTGSPVSEPTAPTDNGDPLGNKYIYQNVAVGRAGIMFNFVGEAQAQSVPLTNENRTFGIALNVYYDGETEPETHYEEFNSYTTKRQTVALSVTPYDTDKVINHVAVAFVYGYNQNAMNIYSATLNIADTGYSVGTEEPTSATEPSTTEPATEEPIDDYVDYEILSESVDKSQPFMSNSTAYNENGNYVVSNTDEAGRVAEYEYDANGNVTLYSVGNYIVEYSYDAAGNVTSLSNPYAESDYTYNGIGNVSAISRNGFSYSFNYNVYNQLVSTAIGGNTIASRTYSAEGRLIRTDFANNQYLENTYDCYGNIAQIESESGMLAKFIYNKKGLVTKAEDVSSGTVTYYQFDFNGSKIGEYRQTNAGALSYRIGYNSNGDKVEKTAVNGQEKTIVTSTDNDGNITVSNDGITVETETDDFGRVAEVKTSYSGSSDFKTQYTYANGTDPNSTSNDVRSFSQQYGNTELLKYYYGYDDAGNLSRISETTNMNSWFESYDYDWLNQIKHIIDLKNQTYTLFVYDDGGNITSVTKSNYDTYHNQPSTLIYQNTYTYGDNNWKDKLTAFNNQTITYDAMGNPLQYRDGMSFTWENGRQLHSVTKNNAELVMHYDSNGLRTQKGSVYYYYDSDNNLIAMVKGNNTLFFYYDESGNATAFSHNGTMYFYVKNLQGDIINIVDTNGSVVVRYNYDIFGAITAVKNGSNQTITDTTSLAFLNPLRYRGYVFDDETGLYYLQSRYYDPVTGRFINADMYADTGSGSPLSTNMFAYCENNTLRFCDFNGEKTSDSRVFGTIHYTNYVYVIYYSYSGGSGNFLTQARQNYHYFAISPTKLVGVQTKNDFIKAWNSIDSKYKYVFILVHGGEGFLSFKDGEIYNFSSLKQKSFLQKVWLFSCKGGFSRGRYSRVSRSIALRAVGAIVYALECSLSYSLQPFWGYYARPSRGSKGYWIYERCYYVRGRLNYHLSYV